MNQCFDFKYEGLEVKAYYDPASNDAVIEDFTTNIAGVPYTMSDFEWNTQFDKVLSRLELEAMKNHNERTQNARD